MIALLPWRKANSLKKEAERLAEARRQSIDFASELNKHALDRLLQETLDGLSPEERQRIINKGDTGKQ